jgi:hypothetical protein
MEITKLKLLICLCGLSGYIIHGNESSGAGAAIALTYYLAACESPELENIGKYRDFIRSLF